MPAFSGQEPHQLAAELPEQGGWSKPQLELPHWPIQLSNSSELQFPVALPAAPVVCRE